MALQQQQQIDALRKQIEELTNGVTQVMTHLQTPRAAPAPATPGAPQATTVIVMSRDIPEGLAASFLSKHGFYPDDAQLDRLLNIHYKLQPSLRELPNAAEKVNLAVRNARTHVSRLIRDVMPTLFSHEGCPENLELVKVRLRVFFPLLIFVVPSHSDPCTVSWVR